MARNDNFYKNVPLNLKMMEAIPENKKYRPHLPSPPTLAELASAVLQKESLPPAWYWTSQEVAKWVEVSLGLFQYKECFIRNYINGRKLISVDASMLPKINITLFDDIKKITAGIRNLFGIEYERYHRSISLPPRYPETLYLYYRQPTGPIREGTTRLEFFRIMKMARELQPPECWYTKLIGKSKSSDKIYVGMSREKRKPIASDSFNKLNIVTEDEIPCVKKYSYPLRPSLYVLNTVDLE